MRADKLQVRDGGLWWNYIPEAMWYQPTVRFPEASEGEQVPGPRAAHSCNLIGNKMIVFGGWNGKKGLNDLHVLDVDKLEWSVPNCTGVTPSARNNHATFTVGTRLYVHGGHDGSKWLADLHCLDTEKMEWSVPSPAGTCPSARACHTTTTLGRKLYMFGGYDGAKCFNDLDVLDLDTMVWIQPRVNGQLPQARNAQTVTVVGNKLFLFGGHSGNKHLRDLHILDTETMTWSQPDNVSGSAPPGLRGHTATLVGSKIVLYGGYDGRGRSNDLYLLDPRKLCWEHPAPTDKTPAGRQRHTACLIGSKKLFVLGGFDGFKWLNDLHVLDVAKLEETEITTQAVTTLLSDLRGLLNDPESFPDITFIVEGMRESRESEITFPDWTYVAFLAMLEFLYTGSLSDVTNEVAEDLMGLADHIGLEGLKALCQSSLIRGVDTSNVCTLYRAAHLHEAIELKRHCMDFILKRNSDIDLDALSSEPLLLLEITRELMARQKASTS